MDNSDLVPIGEAAELLGVSVSTLRRWDEKDILSSVRKNPTSHRYFSKKTIAVYLNDLLKLATEWISSGKEIPNIYYCNNSATFQSRLTKFQDLLAKSENEKIKEIFPLVVAVAGEIGNNSFDHNLGNWPDIAGIFFAYDINKRQVVLADRGQGILATLKRVRPSLIDDKEALSVAFTEVVSGRAPEERGNGLKFVKAVVTKSLMGLFFQTGSAELELRKDSSDLRIKDSNRYFRGCIAVINF